VIQDKTIPMIWKLIDVKKNYYLAKQHAFNGINFYYALKVKNTAASATGSSILSLSLTLTISFIGALFISLIENHLPAGNLKTTVKNINVIIAFPISIAELVTNSIVSTFEKLIINEPLPTNDTEVYVWFH
jgi:hypothetical protein